MTNFEMPYEQETLVERLRRMVIEMDKDAKRLNGNRWILYDYAGQIEHIIKRIQENDYN